MNRPTHNVVARLTFACVCALLPGRALPAALTVHAFGDSLSTGFDGASDPSKVYINMLAAAEGWTVINHAVNGSQVADQAPAIYGVSPDFGSVFTYQLGTNDLAQYRGNSTAQQTFQRIHLAELAWLSIPNSAKILANSAQVSFSGTWTNSALTPFGKSSFVKGSSATFEVTGNTIFVGYLVFDGSQSAFTITVDGVNQGTFVTLPGGVIAALSTILKSNYGPEVAVITGLANTRHTVTITATSADAGNPIYFDWASGINADNQQTGPTVYVGNIPRFSANTYAVNFLDPALTDLYNGLIATNVAELRSFGLNVIPADVHALVDPVTDLAPDGLHPNDSGQRDIETAYLAAIHPPTLAPSPPSLAFSYAAGSIPAGQFLSVTSSGANFAFTATSASSWLSASPSSATTTANLLISVSPGLSPGSYSGAIAITGAGIGSKLVSVVPVNLTVTAPACAYALSPSSQSFSSNGGAGSFTVTAGALCNWTAVSNSIWLPITGGASGGGAGTVSFSVAANTGNTSRIGTISVAGQSFTVTQSGIPTASTLPAAVVRDVFGGMRLMTFGSAALQNAGGVFGSDPGAAQKPNGDTVAVARDNYNGIWINTYSASLQTWLGWIFAGGILQGVPAIAIAPDGTAYFAGRDNFGAYYLNSYNGAGFSGWKWLGGVFGADPALAATPDGSIYLIARDNYNGMWSGRYIPGSGFQGWVFGGGITPGKPSATGGNDNAVYVAMRDPSNAIWMGRVQGNAWSAWQPAGGVMATDPQVASGGSSIYAAAVDAFGGVWYNAFALGTGNNWVGWTPAHGIMQSVSAASSSGKLYLAARESSGRLWWQDASAGNWIPVGFPGLAIGQPAAGPH